MMDLYVRICPPAGVTFQRGRRVVARCPPRRQRATRTRRRRAPRYAAVVARSPEAPFRTREMRKAECRRAEKENVPGMRSAAVSSNAPLSLYASCLSQYSRALATAWSMLKYL